ncbi:MAG: FAD-dependent oxidoreductase [Ilumatobacter sp.]|nr:FAD-dependent oxidoreductase [Ilumatobacter sp.]
MTRNSPRPTDRDHLDGVVVIGGGYAGVTAAQSAQQAGVPTTLIDPTDCHDLTTRLAAVAGGTAPVDDATIPLDRLVERSIRACVTSVDDGAVTLDDGRTVTADAVVMTVGSVSMRPPIDGLQHAPSLRTAEQAVEIRGLIESTSDRLVIVGGGPTGVQLAGAAAAAHPDLAITLIDGNSRLLSEMSDELGEHARRILDERDVEVILECLVDTIDEGGVLLPDGGGRRDGSVVFTGGFEADAKRFGLPVHDDGRIDVGRDLRVVDHDRTFAAGDVAAHIDRNGERLPMSAQIAVQAGHHAGANAARLVQGRQLTDADLQHRGWVMDLGGWQGLATVGPLTLAGPWIDRLPPVLHFGIDAKHLVDVTGFDAWRHLLGRL